MDDSSLISIIIPTYNRSSIIGATLDSILAQSYKNWECIIVDDASTDSTSEFIKKYTEDARISFIRNTRKKGAPGARNTGLLEAKGEFIFFFDSDNVMKQDALKLLLQGAQDNHADVATCFAEVLNDQEQQVNTFSWKSYGDISTKILSGETYVDYNIALIRTAALDKIGLTDEDCPAYQEWDTHIRLSEYANYHTVEEKLILYYQREKDTISSDKYRSVNGFLYVLEKNLNRFSEHPDLLKKQGLILLRTAKMINDPEFSDQTRRKLNTLIPGFKTYQVKTYLRNLLYSQRKA